MKNIHRHILWALTAAWIFLFLSCESPAGNPPVSGDTTPPGGITNMETTLGEGGQITFTWTDPADEDFNHIEITYIPTGSVLQPIVVTKETQTTTVTGLTEGISYTFTFQAVDKTGNKNTGQTITLSLDSTPPAGVTGLIGILRSGGTVQLTWTDPVDADLKHIEITWADGESETAAKGAGAWTSSTLTEGTAYTFTVKAVDTVGNKSAGRDAGPLTPDATAPTNVVDLNGTLGNGEVTLTWTDPSDDDLDHIEITWTAGGGGNETVTKGIGTWTSSGLTEGTAYTFTVKAVDAAGNKNTGQSSNPLTPDATAPANVTGLNGTLLAGGKVKLTWTDPSDGDLDHIEITWTAGGGGNETVAKGIRTWTSPNLTTETTFTLKAVDTVGNKNAGETVTKIPDATAPEDVTGLSGTLRAEGRVELTWTDPDADLDHVEITWSPGGDDPVTVAKETETWTSSGLPEGTVYTFTVKAVDAAGNKNAGATVTKTPDATPPTNVTNLDGTPGDAKVTLTWTDPTDADLDHIEITWSPGEATPISVEGAQTTTITGLTNGTVYTFTVKAVDEAGNKSAGETKALTPLAPTGLVKVEFDGLPEDETITLSGLGSTLSWAANTALTVSVSETFDSYRWALDDTIIAGETGNSLTLNAGNLSVKQHSLTALVTKNGVEYAKRVVFTVGQ